MTRGKWTWSEEEQRLVPYVEHKPDVNAPFVLTDDIPGGIKSHADGRMYTSKRKLRDAYRRLGKVEVGNDTRALAPKAEPKERERREADVRADLERTWYDLRDNNAKEMDADTRERCKRIDDNLKHYNYDNRERDRDGST